MAERNTKGSEYPIAEADQHSDAETQGEVAAQFPFERKRNRQQYHQRRNKRECEFYLQINFIRCGINALGFHVGDLFLQVKKCEFVGIASEQLEIGGSFSDGKG